MERDIRISLGTTSAEVYDIEVTPLEDEFRDLGDLTVRIGTVSVYLPRESAERLRALLGVVLEALPVPIAVESRETDLRALRDAG